MTHLAWKLVHDASVVLFPGNIMTGVFWAAHACRTRDLRVVAVVFDGLVRSDRWITLPSVVLILLSGIALAVRARLPVLGTGWLLWASVAFSVSGILFGVRVGPLQKRIRDFAAVASGADDWPRFTRFYRQWKVFGVLSVGAAAVAFLLMVLKPELPGF